MSSLIAWILRAIPFGTIIMYGALGETITEKSGNLNLGVPGIMYLGGFAGFASAYYYENTVAEPVAILSILLALVSALAASALGGLIYAFLTITLRAMLFDPMSAALGAATGELVFSEIMLGQFGGLGELEKFITVTIGVYIAGRLVRDPRNRKMVGAAAIGGVVIQQVLGCIVDIAKVQFGVEDFEAVAGLPESVFVTEGFACLNDILFSGILFCLLPTLYLVPKLYGKIAPLLGMQPRTEKTALEPIGGKVVIGALIAFAVALASELLATAGFSVIDWEAEWAESSTALAVGIVAAAVLAVVIVLVMRKNGEKTAKKGV